MKIMIVTPYFSPKIGGLENYALNIAKGLQSMGHDILIVTSNDKEKKYTDSVIEGLRVIKLPILLKLSNTPFNLSWYFAIKKILKSEKPDIINAHTPVPFISDMAARAKGKTRFILTYHNDLVKPNGIGKYLAKLFYVLFINHTLKVSDSIVTTSDYYAEASPYLKKYRSKINSVSPGIDPNIFNARSRPGVTTKKRNSKKNVLFAGNLDKTHSHKGLDVLIKAFSKMREDTGNVQLVVIGKGDGIEGYRQQVKELDQEENVTFTGYISDIEYANHLKTADLFVLPSTTDSEGFGMVALEASACGVPVVASNVGGIPIVVRDGFNGKLVEPNNSDALAESIRTLLNDSSLQAKYGANGAEIALGYSWESKAVDMDKIVKDISKPRVCIIHNMVSPYRLPVFENLSKQVNLTVLFCTPITKDRKWKFNLKDFSFNNEILKGFVLGPLIINWNALAALRRSRFDVIIANNDPDVAVTAITGFLLAKLTRRRIIGWSQVVDMDVHFFPTVAYGTKPYQKALRYILGNTILIYRRICIAFANRYVVLSKQAGKYLEILGVPPELITHVPQVMPAELLPDPDKTNRDGNTVLYVGYLNERKGVKYLIEGFMNIKESEAKLLIAGTGPTREALIKQASSDSRITFLNYVEGKEKANLYAKSDIFVLPTLNDVWGLVINEAIHYGLAVVSTKAAVAREIIDSKTGILVNTRSPKEIEAALHKLLSNKKILKDMQNHNIKDTSKQDIRLTVERFCDAIKYSLEGTS